MWVVQKWGKMWKTNNSQIGKGNCVHYFYGVFSVAGLSTCINPLPASDHSVKLLSQLTLQFHTFEYCAVNLV